MGKSMKTKESMKTKKRMKMEKLDSTELLTAGPFLFDTADEFFKLKNWLKPIGIIISGQPRAIGEMGDKVSEISDQLKKECGKVVDVNAIDSITQTFLKQYKQSFNSDTPEKPANYVDAYNTFVDFSKLVKESIEKVKKSDYFNKLKEKGEEVMIKSKKIDVSFGDKNNSVTKELCVYRAKSQFFRVSNLFERDNINVNTVEIKRIEDLKNNVSEVSKELKNKFGKLLDFNDMENVSKEFLKQYEKSSSSGDYANTADAFEKFCEVASDFILRAEYKSDLTREEFLSKVTPVFETMDQQLKSVGVSMDVTEPDTEEKSAVIVGKVQELLTGEYGQVVDSNAINAAAKDVEDQFDLYRQNIGLMNARKRIHESILKFSKVVEDSVKKIKESKASSSGEDKKPGASSSGEDKKPGDFLSKDKCEEIIKKALLTLDERFKEIGLYVISQGVNSGLGLENVVSGTYGELLDKFKGHVDKDLGSAKDEFMEKFREAKYGVTEGNYRSALEAFKNFYNISAKNVKEIRESDYFKESQEKNAGGFGEKEFLNKMGLKPLSLIKEAASIGLKAPPKRPTSAKDVSDLASNIYEGLKDKYSEVEEAPLYEVDWAINNFNEKVRSSHDGNFILVDEAFEQLYSALIRVISKIRYSGKHEELQQAGGNQNNPYLAEVLSMYGKLVERARKIFKDLETKSPTSLGGVRKATENLREKINGRNIGIFGYRDSNSEWIKSISAYYNNPNEDNGKKVIESYKKLYGSISSALDKVFDDSLDRENGQGKRQLNETISYYFRELEKEVGPVIGEVQYGKINSYRDAAYMIEYAYERVIEKAGAQKDEALITSLSKTLDSYYEGSISSPEVSKAIGELKDVIIKTVRSMPKAPAEGEKKAGPVKPPHRPSPKPMKNFTGFKPLPKLSKNELKEPKSEKKSSENELKEPKSEKKPPKNNKSDKAVQKALEGIFKSSIVKYFSQSGGDGAVENFGGVYKEFKAVKTTCPIWYQFMKSVFSAGVVPASSATNKTLIGILLASCGAADSIAISDSVCRAVRKITKDPKIKNEEYIVKAEKMRKDLKDMINKVSEPEELDEFIRAGLQARFRLPIAVFTTVLNKVRAARPKK